MSECMSFVFDVPRVGPSRAQPSNESKNLSFCKETTLPALWPFLICHGVVLSRCFGHGLRAFALLRSFFFRLCLQRHVFIFLFFICLINYFKFPSDQKPTMPQILLIW